MEIARYTYANVELGRQEDFTGDRTSNTKTYSYHVYGHPIGMTDKKTGAVTPDEYTYGYDVHGSTSMLLKDTGGAKASYGYIAYGQIDDKVSSDDNDKQSDADLEDALSPYRYSATRFDGGSQTINMGAPLRACLQPLRPGRPVHRCARRPTRSRPTRIRPRSLTRRVNTF